MAMSAGGGGGVQSTPNVTPMIDVMLVLLIIFMVVTPMLMAGFNAEPPVAQNIKDHPEDEATDQIAAALHRIYVETPRDDRIMYLKADKNLEYSKVIDALDIAAVAGVRVTGLITDQRPGTMSTIPGDILAPGAPKKEGNP